MRSFKLEGIIIKRKDLGEADRILTVFTKEEGKLQIKATGIRKIPSRRSAHVELLNNASLSLFRGYKFPILTEAHMLENFDEIKQDLTKVGFAYHLCELVDGLCPENEKNTQIFYLLKQTLTRLATDEEELATIVHEFEVELLTNLGFWNNRAVHEHLNTHAYIESILERKLKSRKIFTKLS